jgi:Ca2+/Na+ antiporter
MTDEINKSKPKKMKQVLMIALLAGEFIFFSVMIWAMWFYIMNDIPWFWFLVIYLLILLFAGVIFYLSRRKRLQMEKELTETPPLRYDDNRIEQEISKPLRGAKILHYILTPIIYLSILMLVYVDLFNEEIIPVKTLDNNTLNILTIVVVVFTIMGLYYSFRLPRIMINGYKKNPLLNQKLKQGTLKLGGLLFSIDILKWAMANAICVYGLILALFGVKWYITAPFFIVSIIMQIFIFPTRKKWKQIANEIMNSTSI